MAKCASIIAKDEGLGGFYKALVPLWGRQIPYTMMKASVQSFKIRYGQNLEKAESSET
jgi:hypothetical protein